MPSTSIAPSPLLACTSAVAGIDTISFEAFAVEHSLRAPAVGYRIRSGRITAFYVPDLAAIRGACTPIIWPRPDGDVPAPPPPVPDEIRKLAPTGVLPA